MSDHLTEHNDIAETIATMRRMYASERVSPDPAFSRELERRLLHTSNAALPVGPVRLPQRGSAAHNRSASIDRSPVIGRFQWLGLLVLIGIVAASSIWFVGRENGEQRTLESPERSASLLWSLPSDDTAQPEGFYVAATNDVIVRLKSAGNPGFIEAFQAETGERLWQRDIWASGMGASLGAQWGTSIAIDRERIYVPVSPETVQALDIATGEQLWSTALSGSGLSIQIQGDNLFVWHWDNTLTVLDARSGDVIWSTGVLASPDVMMKGPFIAETAVLMIVAPGELRAYNADTGEVLWNYVDDFGTFNATMASSFDERGETLYLQWTGSTSESNVFTRTLIAMDASSGTLIWRTSFESDGNFGLAADFNRVYAVDARMEDQIGTPTTMEEVRGRVYAYDRTSGELVWQSEPGPMRVDLVLSEGGVLTSFGFGYSMAVIDTTTQQARCSIAVQDLNLYSNERVMAGERMIMLQQDGTLIAIDPVASCAG
jgi:outer membrane protein assembly factor BamB